jgi:uncharacterized membrane protein YvbJ
MFYCPKCGNKVDETMFFCPRCGTSLKSPPPSQPTPIQPYQQGEKAEKNERQEKSEKDQKKEKNGHDEKTEHGFIGYLIGGLILITVGVFALIELSGKYFSSSQDLAIMLFIIGLIIIFGAIYVALTSRRHFPQTH